MSQSTPQKIVIIGPAYPYRGGIATYNERLAKEFSDKGCEVKIETFSLQYPDFLFPGKTQYSDSEPPKELIIQRSINSVWPLNWFAVGDRIKKEKPDLVIVRYWLPFMGPSLGTIVRRIKSNEHTKVICLADNIIPHEKRIGDQLFTNYFLNGIDALLAMTQKVLDDALRFRQLPTALSPHPIFDNFGLVTSKEDACKKLGLDPSINYLLFFGLIRDYKGLDILLDAFADKRLKDSNTKLIIAGEFYSSADKYHEQIKRHNLSERIILKDIYIPDNEVADYFNAASLVVQPYKTATQSGVTQVAYHFNKPMVVTNVGGLKEMIPDGKVGFVVEPNADVLAEAINRFFKENKEAEFQQNIGEEKKKYSWPLLVNAFNNLYQKLKKDD
jgi:glycosyltransferase involved in cell wall biosynthesis